jgi:hypothetical protein
LKAEGKNDLSKKCLILGEKLAIHWFRNYFVIVTQDASSGRSSTRPSEADDKVKNILTIFDLQNKFIAYTAPVRTVMALVRILKCLFSAFYYFL